MVDVGTCFSLRDYIRYMNFENDLLSVALEVVSNANSITQLFFFAIELHEIIFTKRSKQRRPI